MGDIIDGPWIAKEEILKAIKCRFYEIPDKEAEVLTQDFCDFVMLNAKSE